MINVNVDASGLMRLGAELSGQGKQVAFATMRALNAAAFKAMKATEKEMSRVFDRPTPWVMRSVRYVKATRTKLEAQVDFDFWGNKQGVTVAQVLRAEIEGGYRRLKRHELALQRVGILPPGMAIVPGAAATRDSYGNMSAGQINQIVSWFRAFGEQGYSANMKDAGRRRLARGNAKTGAQGFAYFVLRRPHGKLLPGVYQRFSFGALGSSVKPVMIFVRVPQYRRALDFYGVAQRAAVDEFNQQFPRMLDDALRTAR